MPDEKDLTFLISQDEAFCGEMEETFRQKELPFQRFRNLPEAYQHISTSGKNPSSIHLVADQEALPGENRENLLQLHKRNPFLSLILVEPPYDPTFSTGKPMRFHLPLGSQFLSMVRDHQEQLLVFLADPTTFLCEAVQTELQDIGLQPLVLDSYISLMGILQAIKSPDKESTLRGLMDSMLGKSKRKEVEIPKAAVVLWEGSLTEQKDIERQLQKLHPNLRCVLILGASLISQAEAAIRTGKPAVLPKASIPWMHKLILRQFVEDLNSKGRVLLVSNHKPELKSLAKGLWTDGYEVVALNQVEKALQTAQAMRFHIAVVGSALAYASLTGKDLSLKLRQMDPDLRIILLVDRYPIQTALQGLSQVVEVGLDDCLLKPVDPSRLQFSISRALEKRKLILENLRLIEELQKANQQLAQHNQFQSKFFAMVTHDVRNPLAAITGFAQLLHGRMERPNDILATKTIMEAADILNALISDLVDLAAIQSGKLRIDSKPMDLVQTIRGVQSRVAITAEQKKINFSVAEPMPPTLRIMGDVHRMAQVLTNLCTNALQYTPANGQVTLSARVESGEAVVSIQDTGIGISPEDLPRIFERFFQAANAQKHRKGGFGLGLTITKEILEAHGGKVGVESQLGKGSRFYVVLPLLQESPPPHPKQIPMPQPNPPVQS